MSTANGRPRRTHFERGAAAVEMALVLPLLLLVVGGIIDFGRMFYTQEILTNAAREGARMVAVGYTTAQADVRIGQAAVAVTTGTTTYQYCNESTATPSCSASATPCPGTPTATDAVKVIVTTPPSGASKFTFLLITPISRFFGAGVSAPILTGSSSMRCGG